MSVVPVRDINGNLLSERDSARVFGHDWMIMQCQECQIYNSNTRTFSAMPDYWKFSPRWIPQPHYLTLDGSMFYVFDNYYELKDKTPSRELAELKCRSLHTAK